MAKAIRYHRNTHQQERMAGTLRPARNNQQQWLIFSSLLSASCTIAVSSAGRKQKSAQSTHCDLSRFSPTPPIRIFRPNPDVEIAFDVRTRNPVYVLERLRGENGDESRSLAPKRRPNFYEEKSLPEKFRSRNNYYHLSGYDRGHMAPAANYVSNPDHYYHTYNLCNVSPQDHAMNVKVWANLEEWTRRVARVYTGNDSTDSASDSSECYVITGPLWLPSRQVSDKRFEYGYAAIGKAPTLVSVPTHFYKVVAIVNTRSSTISHYACFVIPNSPVAKDWRLEDALVRWGDLETVTGLEFFSTLVDSAWIEQADNDHKIPPRISDSNRSLPLILFASDSQPVTSRGQKRGGVRHLCPGGTCPSLRRGGS